MGWELGVGRMWVEGCVRKKMLGDDSTRCRHNVLDSAGNWTVDIRVVVLFPRFEW